MGAGGAQAPYPRNSIVGKGEGGGERGKKEDEEAGRRGRSPPVLTWTLPPLSGPGNNETLVPSTLGLFTLFTLRADIDWSMVFLLICSGFNLDSNSN